QIFYFDFRHFPSPRKKRPVLFSELAKEDARVGYTQKDPYIEKTKPIPKICTLLPCLHKVQSECSFHQST
ncbi:hypothetical protein, partial [Enterococcus faecium]|uniref:hypothetical protein n=1 Tax=Enterococcus faecium TaxID=1352 RepID=UPI001C612B05